MIYLQYAVAIGLVGFAIWYVGGMVKDLFSSNKKKKGCDKCDSK